MSWSFSQFVCIFFFSSTLITVLFQNTCSEVGFCLLFYCSGWKFRITVSVVFIEVFFSSWYVEFILNVYSVHILLWNRKLNYALLYILYTVCTLILVQLTYISTICIIEKCFIFWEFTLHLQCTFICKKDYRSSWILIIVAILDFIEVNNMFVYWLM